VTHIIIAMSNRRIIPALARSLRVTLYVGPARGHGSHCTSQAHNCAGGNSLGDHVSVRMPDSTM
jgi:hypothetical protein